MNMIEEQRLKFHNKLIAVLPVNFSIYFNAPTNISLTYPAAIYKRDGMNRKNADDKVYIKRCKYTLSIIDDTPTQSYIDDMLEAFDYISFDRQYVYDGLNHYIFTIFF